MKKAIIVCLAVVGLGLIAFFALRPAPNPEPTITDSNHTRSMHNPAIPPSDSGNSALNDSKSGSATQTSLLGNQSSNSAAADPSKPPIVGRRTYPSSIQNDQRVRSQPGGNVLTEGHQIAIRLNDSETAVEEDLESLEQILDLYRLSFQQNPVAGDNQMVMEALMGNNPGNLVVFPKDHPAIDANGQLLDRWGTPYFFHALSGTQMEIFSAGPDKEFNTSDDIQRTERDGRPLTGATETPEPEIEP